MRRRTRTRRGKGEERGWSRNGRNKKERRE